MYIDIICTYANTYVNICIKHLWKGHTQWHQKVYSSPAMKILAQSSVATWSAIKLSGTLQGRRNPPGLGRNKAVYDHLCPTRLGYAKWALLDWHPCHTLLAQSWLQAHQLQPPLLHCLAVPPAAAHTFLPWLLTFPGQWEGRWHLTSTTISPKLTHKTPRTNSKLQSRSYCH